MDVSSLSRFRTRLAPVNGSHRTICGRCSTTSPRCLGGRSRNCFWPPLPPVSLVSLLARRDCVEFGRPPRLRNRLSMVEIIGNDSPVGVDLTTAANPSLALDRGFDAARPSSCHAGGEHRDRRERTRDLAERNDAASARNFRAASLHAPRTHGSDGRRQMGRGTVGSVRPAPAQSGASCVAGPRRPPYRVGIGDCGLWRNSE